MMRQGEGVLTSCQRNDRFVLPAIAFVVGFGEPDPDAGKAHFTEQRFERLREEPDFFITLPERMLGAPLQTDRGGGGNNGGGFAGFKRREGEFPDFIARRRERLDGGGFA